MIPEIYNLKNGPRCIILSDSNAHAVVAMVMIRVGSRNENLKEWGISHALEHLVFKGTKAFPKPENLSSTLDACGADYNAFTSKESTAFYVRAAAVHLPLALRAIAQLSCAPLLRSSDWPRERNVIIEELKMYEENPLMAIDDIIDTSAFGEKSSLGRSIGGTAKSLQGITMRDIRSYWNTHYLNGDMTVVVAGKCTPHMVKKIVAKEFPKRNLIKSFQKMASPEFTPRFVQKIIPGDQVHVAFSWLATGEYDHAREIWSILSTILGGGMSSRLFLEVREKRGLAYSVSSSLETYHDSGLFVIRAGIDAARCKEAVRVIFNVVARAAKNGFSKKEIEAAKTQIAGRRALRFEDKANIATWYATRAIWGIEDTIEKSLQRLFKVSLTDVANACTGLLIKPACAVVGSPRAVEEIRSLYEAL